MNYTTPEPDRSEIDAMQGLTLLEFGAPACAYCVVAKPLIQGALTSFPQVVNHIKIEDGSGRPLGRSFSVRLWPTLVLIRDGKELSRLVRPTREVEIMEMLESSDTM